jgi:hypothetical protein
VKIVAAIALAGLVIAGLVFGASEAQISSKTMIAVENAMNDRFRAPDGPDPYDLLGTARGTYLDGYGALITVELQLVYTSGINPFRPAYSPQEIAALRERKLKKLPVLRDAMRSLMASSAVTLDSLPLNQRVAIEARLWRYGWEDSKGLPRRILMSAEKSKLLAAKADPAALAAAIDDQEQ